MAGWWVEGKVEGEEGEMSEVGGELRAWQFPRLVRVTLIRSSSSHETLLSPQDSLQLTTFSITMSKMVGHRPKQSPLLSIPIGEPLSCISEVRLQ
jgi:hypothetical protein